MHESDLSTEAVLAKLDGLVADDRNTTAKMIEMLVVVEERRIHLELAYASMFDFCTRKLRLSEGSAMRRLTAARLVQRFPQLLEAIEEGRIHLSNLVLLRDLLTADNVDDLVAAASGRSKREVLELVARLAPKPDVAPSIRRLPEQDALTPPTTAPSPPPLQRNAATAKPASPVPLSEGRYKVEFTADTALHADIERARALMSHRNPNGDLTVVFAEAMKGLVEKLEKERLAKTARPRTSRGSAKPAHVTKAVRREVVQRDGEQCSFVAADGTRCPAKEFLELDHRQPKALGGTGEASNVRLLCRAHNRLAAENVFGRDYINERIHRHRRRCGSTAGSREVVRAALVSMGFKPSEAERALSALEPSAWTEPIESLLRDALGALI